MPSSGPTTAIESSNLGHRLTGESAASQAQIMGELETRPFLDKLPNELWQKIIGFLYHNHLVNFALTCKFVNQQAEGAIREHLHFSKRWRKGICPNMTHGYLASKVAQHLVDPRLASYPETLSVLELSAPVSSLDGSAPGRFVEEATSEHVRQCWTERFGIGSWGRWKSSVEKGNLDFILTTWWSMLPNLRALFLFLEDHEWSLTLDMVKPVNDRHHEHLKHLQTVRIVGPNPQAFAFLELFSRVPSVTVLSANRIGIDDPATYPSVLRGYNSNVENFHLDNCTIGTRHVVDLLEAMMHLRYFGYSEAWMQGDCLPVTDRTALMDTLRKGSTRSLTQLEFEVHVNGGLRCGIPLGSLEVFEALEDITMNPTDFLKGWKRLSKKSPILLRTGLPRSLKKLAFGNRNGTLNPNQAATIAGILRRAKEDCLPDLQKLKIIGLPIGAESSLLQNRNVQGLKALNVHTEIEWGYEESETDDEDRANDDDVETDSCDGEVDSDVGIVDEDEQ